MLFVLTPQAPSQAYFDPEQAYADYRRREYVAALQEQHQRAQFERELALEEQRHRHALASIAQQEAARRQSQASFHFAARRPQQQEAGHPGCGAGRARFACAQPAPEEILRRRQARQAEEERLSREFHQHILSQIFGVPSDEQPAASTSKQQEPTSVPVASTSKGKEYTAKLPLNEEPQPHWSAAPERARALAEITSVTRTFTSLKNTFVFPSGPLERLPGSDVPRLAYNPTNASIHAYEHALAELLTKLDGVESHGFRGVREARKQLVVKIEKFLEELEKQVAERLAEAASPATVPTAIPASPTVAHAEEKEIQDVVMEDNTQVSADQESSNTGGYDVEPETAPETVMEDASEPVSSEAAPIVAPPTEEPITAVAPSEMLPAVPSDAAPQRQPEEAHEPTTLTSAVLPASSSDDESEIEDAVHIDIEVSSEEEDVVEAKHDADDAHSDSDGAFEML